MNDYGLVTACNPGHLSRIDELVSYGFDRDSLESAVALIPPDCKSRVYLYCSDTEPPGNPLLECDILDRHLSFGFEIAGDTAIASILGETDHYYSHWPLSLVTAYLRDPQPPELCERWSGIREVVE